MAIRLILVVSLCLCFLAAGLAPARAQAPRPDYSKLKLEGNGMWQDSLSLTLQAAARLYGREADYETLYCLTANAFAPAIDLREDCTAHWHCEARHTDRAIGNAAAFLGLRATRVDIPVLCGEGEVAEREQMREFADLLQREMGCGAVLVPLDGWDVDGPHGFTHWAWAGVATQADPVSGSVLAAHLNGYADNPIVWPATTWALSPSANPIDRAEADRQMLRHALDRIRGKGVYRRTATDVFGLDAMDAWIKHMQTVKGFCGPCYGRDPGSSVGDADDNARHMQHGARTAAAYLELGTAVLPEPARPHIAQVSAHYRRIADLLDPCLTGARGEGYQQIIGDLAKQRVHAESVLKPVRAELAAAADEIDLALKAWPAKTK